LAETDRNPFSTSTWVSQLPLDSQSPVILIFSILTGQAKNLYAPCPCFSNRQHSAGYTLPAAAMTALQRVLKQRFYGPDALSVAQPMVPLQ